MAVLHLLGALLQPSVKVQIREDGTKALRRLLDSGDVQCLYEYPPECYERVLRSFPTKEQRYQ